MNGGPKRQADIHAPAFPRRLGCTRDVRPRKMPDMTSPTLAPIHAALESGGPESAATALIDSLRERREYDKLFDALLIKARLGLGLPVARPTSFDDVPAEKQAAFEEAYVAAARSGGFTSRP